MKPADIHAAMFATHRDIYQVAELYNQNRVSPSELVDILASPDDHTTELFLKDGTLKSTFNDESYPVDDNVIDCRGTNITTPVKENWAEKNVGFLNYHKSLGVYTLVNSQPINNYLGVKSGLASIKDATIVDVGGGTGHVFASFFRFPHTLRYINVDPNLRLLHDQFIRVYPQLLELKMGHILGFAEKLPFKKNSVDVVMSLSSIDHMKNYESFIAEAFAILKPGGTLLISSHLDIPGKVTAKPERFPIGFLEKLTRYLYYKLYKNKSDDHTFHFDTHLPIKEKMIAKGFTIESDEVFSRHFFIKGIRP